MFFTYLCSNHSDCIFAKLLDHCRTQPAVQHLNQSVRVSVSLSAGLSMCHPKGFFLPLKCPFPLFTGSSLRGVRLQSLLGRPERVFRRERVVAEHSSRRRRDCR